MPFPGCVPELTDGAVRLRAHRPEDAERIVEQSNDPESKRWTTVPRPYALEQAHEFLASIESGWLAADGIRHWAVTDAADPDSRYLGTIDVRPRAGGVAGVGFGLHPQGRGQGLMAGAVRLVSRWWFGEGGVRVHWDAARGNFPSWRVAWGGGVTHPRRTPPAQPHPPGHTPPEGWGEGGGGSRSGGRTGVWAAGPRCRRRPNRSA